MSKVTLKCFKSLHLKQQYIPKSAKSSKYSTVTLPRPFRDMVKVNTEVNEFFSTNTVVPQLKHLMLNPKFTSAFHPTHSKLLTWMYRLPFQIMEFVDPSVKHLSSPINIKRQDPRGGGEKLEALCATTISWQQRKVTLFKAEHQEKGSCGKPGLQWNMHPANNDDQQTTRQLWCSHSNYPTESPSFRQF